MKKLFISCPMQGRTLESIENTMLRIKQYAEAWYGEEMEVIDTLTAKMPENMEEKTEMGMHLYFLGTSIQKLGDADIVAVCKESLAIDGFRGCDIEKKIAREYDMNILYIPFEFMKMATPDIKWRHNYEE